MVNLSQTPFHLTQEQSEFVTQTVTNLTLDEKIGQLFFVIGQDENLETFIETYKPGGMMYRPGPAASIKRRSKRFRNRLIFLSFLQLI